MPVGRPSQEEINKDIEDLADVRNQWREEEKNLRDVQRIDQETKDLVKLLDTVFISQDSEVAFKEVLSKIAKAIKDFGLEKFRQDYLIINRLVISRVVNFQDLPENIRQFMYSSFNCLKMLAEHYPDEWKKEQELFEVQRNAQVAEACGEGIKTIYEMAVNDLRRPNIPQPVMEEVTKKILLDLVTRITSYDFSSQKGLIEIYEQALTELPPLVSAYIQRKLDAK